MSVTLEQLETEAEEIRTNSLPNSNTAELVGQHLLHIKEYLSSHGSENLYYSIDGIATLSITNRLTNCFNSSNKTSVNLNASYNATITAQAGYTINSVIITMGGTNVTSSVYSNGVITIQRVTGDIIITATASADAQAGLFDNASWFNGYWTISSNNATQYSNNYYLCNYFFGLPSANYTIAPKTIAGYKVGIRPFVCRSVEGEGENQIGIEATRSSTAYGQVGAGSVTTDMIKALDSNAQYFSITIWIKSESGSGNIDLRNRTFDEFISVTRN